MPNGRLPFRHLLALVALIVAPSLASADPINLVENGGFETGTFSGWSVTGPCQFVLSSITSSSCSGLDADPGPAQGTFAAYLGAAIGTGGRLKQTLATTAGAFYDLSFSLANTTFAGLGGVLPNTISVLWGGATIGGATNLAVSGYNTIVFSGLTALAAGTVLEFDTGHSPAYFLLDDVTVKQVPEPATLTLFGIAMATMGTRRWWKQREAQRAGAAARV